MDKVYRLKNGYSISKNEFYSSSAKWCIYALDGNLYMRCISFKEAYELGVHLIMQGGKV